MTRRQKHLVVDVLPEAGITVADIQMLLFWMQSVFNVFVYHVFVCMYEYAEPCQLLIGTAHVQLSTEWRKKQDVSLLHNFR